MASSLISDEDKIADLITPMLESCLLTNFLLVNNKFDCISVSFQTMTITSSKNEF